jgi:hypothetical protein
MGRRARSSTPARRQPPRLRAFAILLVALRILVSLAVFQVSELGHFGVELAEHVALL